MIPRNELFSFPLWKEQSFLGNQLIISLQEVNRFAVIGLISQKNPKKNAGSFVSNSHLFCNRQLVPTIRYDCYFYVLNSLASIMGAVEKSTKWGRRNRGAMIQIQLLVGLRCRCIQRVTNWWAPTAISGSWRRFCCLHTPSAPRDTWLPWRRWSALSRGGGRLHLVRIDFYRLNTLTKNQQLNRFILPQMDS